MGPTARLYYFVQTGNLVFKNAQSGKWLYIKAVTGGGRGQKVGGVAFPFGQNNSRLFTSLSERDKANGVHRGGPIPKGVYRVSLPQHNNFAAPGNPPRMVQSCKLTPTGQNMYGRDNFYIHGQGEHGSDGCIVPLYGHILDVFSYVTANNGGFLLVETSERQGVDHDQQFGSKFNNIA